MTETQNVAWAVNSWEFLVTGFLFTVVACLKCPVVRRTVIWHCSARVFMQAYTPSCFLERAILINKLLGDQEQSIMLGCSLYFFLSCLCLTGFDFSMVCLKVFFKDHFDYLLSMIQASGGAIMQETKSIWIASVCWMFSSHLIVLWWLMLWDIKRADGALWCSSSCDHGICLIV